MREELKEEIIEILRNNDDTYEGCITNVLDGLRNFQETLKEGSSVESRILDNIIDTLEEFENDDLDLLGMQDVLLNFVRKVEKNEFLPMIKDRDEVMKLLIKDRDEGKIIKPETIDSLNEIVKNIKGN